MSHIGTILTVTILSGLAGGLAAYLLDSMDPQVDSDLAARRLWWKYLPLGVVVAFAVPLFLSLAQSKLLSDMLASNVADAVFYPNLLIYCGFCIVAAFSSRAFLTNLSQRVMQLVQENRRRIEDASRNAEDAKNKADIAADLAEEAVESKPVDRSVAFASAAEEGDTSPLPSLSEKEREALRAMMNVTFRTQTGIAQDIKVPRNRVGELVDTLATKGLVERTVSPHTGGPRWRITPFGVRVLNAGG